MAPQLISMAKEAAEQGRVVALGPDQVKGIAEMWHADREKIRYLESLLIKMARHAQ
ncbi:MAG: hypothetical protein OSB38_30515 [Paraburkholderia fungorum]|nr:hypothetical protein [Paraburkholderia fungorum]